jgi:hypothetical protein
MNVQYFKYQIYDELNGAKDYIEKAIEIRAMNPTWAKTLADMSATELSHATHLYEMFEQYYKKLSEEYKEMPDYIQETKDCIVAMYVEKTAKVKYMHEMFSK